ncbi:hypothetical protein ACTID9_06255 [Brevibacillus fluminis]|uniref:hypothetical protein n=1 Tax=Brevibacillus fluminis TaxID=511487 RepID=UPI003F886469
MGWQNEDDLLHHLQKLDRVNPPRREFVERLRQTLADEMAAMPQKRRRRRMIAQTGMLTCAVAILLFFLGANQQAWRAPITAVPPVQHPAEPSKQHVPSPPEQVPHNPEDVPPMTPHTPIPPASLSPLIQNEADQKPTQKGVKQPEGGEEKRQPPAGNIMRTQRHAPKAPTVQEQAYAYFQEAGAKDLAQFQVNPFLSAPGRGFVVLNRMVGGIPFLADRYTVELDEAGKPVQSEMIQNAVSLQDFPSPIPAVSAAAAKRYVADRMKLVYTAGSAPHLRYQLMFSGTLDAMSGKQWERSTEEMPPSKSIPVTPAGKNMFAHTAEEAAALLADEFGIEAKGTVTVQNVGAETEYTWEEGQGKRVRVAVAMQTGQLTEWIVIDSAMKKETPDAAQSDNDLSDKAVSALAPYLDASIRELQAAGVQQAGAVRTYYFNQLHEGVPIVDRTFSVTFDLGQEKVIGMRLGIPDGEVRLPAAKSAISREAAAEAYLKTRPLRLAYRMLGEAGQQPKPRLVYYIYYHETPRLEVDAVTGKLIVGSGHNRNFSVQKEAAQD